MKTLKSASKLMAVMAIAGASMASQAATYQISGEITQCAGICAIFSGVGEIADFSFDAPDGTTSISAGDVSNVDIAISTSTGGSLAFVGGTALSSSMTGNGVNQITGGEAILRATGASTGITVQGDLNFDTNTFVAYAVGGDGSLTQIAAGELSAVPVPAAAWLFGSALVGLTAVGRKRRAA